MNSRWWLLSSNSKVMLWYLMLGVALPLVTLLLLGLVQLWQQDLLLLVSGIWLTITVSGFALYRFWLGRTTNTAHLNTSDSDGVDFDPELQQKIAEALPSDLDARPDWAELDRDIWDKARLHIAGAVEQDPSWQELPELCLDLLGFIAAGYEPDKHGTFKKFFTSDSDAQSAEPVKTTLTTPLMFRFTLPEALLVISVASERYRELIVSHIPFADKVTLASLLTIYEQRNHLQRGMRWINAARRTARLTNPFAAALSELREHFTGRLFTQLNTHLQRELKKLLLQEIAQVAMDLHSGRLKTSSAELDRFKSQVYQQDLQHKPALAEPLRVVLLGQVSSGKSALVNAICKSLEAESDILPSGDMHTVHSLMMQDEYHIHLVDSVGITAQDDSLSHAMQLALNADMILMLARATQPARAPDKQLLEQLNTHYENNPRIRRAPLALVVTHIDQLPPRNQWTPPYDLTASDKKSNTIRQALVSCREQLALPDDTPTIPVCVAQQRDHYNIDLLAAQIMQCLEDATQTQLNRRRLEHESTRGGWNERWRQAVNLGHVLGKALFKST